MSGPKHRINPPSTTTQQPTSTIPMPPEALFTGGLGSSMTLLSNFLSENLSSGGSEFRGSFTQLLALNSPGSDAASFGFLGLGDSSEVAGLKSDGPSGSGSVPAFKQNRPASLMVPVPNSPLIQISPAGFSPSAFLNSPAGGFLSPATLSPYGMSHQQALAQVTANAAAALSQSIYPSSSSSSSSSITTTTAQPFVLDASASNLKLLDQIIIPQQQQLEASHHHNKRTATANNNNNQNQNIPAVFPATVDKPADDGYNWRKYGQKQVKGSEYPRSYYKCTHPSCPVKKKVERSKDGHITEIIYKGQHNHDKPPPGRRSAVTKDDDDRNEIDIGFANQRPTNGAGLRLGMELLDHEDAAQATSLHLNGPSDSEESGEAPYRRGHEEDEDERSAKRRNTGGGGTASDAAALSHRTVTEPKIVVQTRSKVDLLDDGYKWRKYGQKVVKGNPNPRSYYKCTTPDCGVRKHVERSSTDPEAVITTYEGKHNHDVPVAKNSNYNNNNNNNNNASGGQQTRATMNNSNNINIDFGNREQRAPPVAFLKLKQEQLQH